jgi:AcrR family transcriptional regulator
MNASEPPARRRAAPGSPDTRRQLLDAARRCVREKGLAGATSREITAAAGANLAAITYHFGSKDDLLAEALFEEIVRRVEPALAHLEAQADPVAGMLDAVRELLAEFERAKRDTLVYLEALLVAARDARYRRRALELHRAVGRRLTDLIIRLREDAIVPTWVDPKAMAALVLAVANGIALQTQLDPSGPGHDALAGQFAGLLVAAADTTGGRSR